MIEAQDVKEPAELPAEPALLPGGWMMWWVKSGMVLRMILVVNDQSGGLAWTGFRQVTISH